MEWINVKNRFPEDDINVVVTDGEDMAIAFYEEDKWFMVSWDMYNFDQDNITHWMSVPELPQKEKKCCCNCKCGE